MSMITSRDQLKVGQEISCHGKVRTLTELTDTHCYWDTRGSASIGFVLCNSAYSLLSTPKPEKKGFAKWISNVG